MKIQQTLKKKNTKTNHNQKRHQTHHTTHQKKHKPKKEKEKKKNTQTNPPKISPTIFHTFTFPQPYFTTHSHTIHTLYCPTLYQTLSLTGQSTIMLLTYHNHPTTPPLTNSLAYPHLQSIYSIALSAQFHICPFAVYRTLHTTCSCTFVVIRTQPCPSLGTALTRLSHQAPNGAFLSVTLTRHYQCLTISPSPYAMFRTPL